MNWDDIKELIKATPEPMRHKYNGLYLGLAYACAQGDGLELDMYDDDLDLAFSPDFKVKDPESFYEAPEPVLDLIRYTFDPRQFLAVAAELDREASITFVNVTRTGEPGSYLRGYHFSMRETEGNNPPDENMPWRNFEDPPQEGQS